MPEAVTASSGFVGVRMPRHPTALALLEAAAVPVAAPSANRFGHVSPTRPEHVMHDLGEHPILVLTPDERVPDERRGAAEEAAAPPLCCAVGIESTVLKLDASAGELVLLRRGGVSEAELQRWLDANPCDFALRRQRTHTDTAAEAAGVSEVAPAPPSLGEDEAAGEEQGEGEGGGMVAPGMLLTHYSPDLPAYLTSSSASSGAMAAGGGSAAGATFPTSSAVVLDFGGRLARLSAAAAAYRDLSPAGDAAEASTRVFEALRWAEQQGASGGRVVLLPNLTATDGDTAARSDESVPALADRLFRAASGQTAHLSVGDTDVVVDARQS